MNYLLNNRMIIMDGNLYLYRAYYTFVKFKCDQGKPSGAIYGFLRLVYKILQKYQNYKKLIIVFDSSKKTFRQKLFENYKKNRKPMPENLYIQINPLLNILKSIGIKTFSIPGVEADDIIGSLAHKFEQKGDKILIISHDKDMHQLVTNNINILNINQNIIITPEIIKEKYGIQPKSYIDLLALMGDASDNIPGIPQIGEKTALLLLKNFSNIQNIYKNLEKIKLLPYKNFKKIASQLIKNKKYAFLYYKLAAIKLNISLNIKSTEISLKDKSIDLLPKLFKKYRCYTK